MARSRCGLGLLAAIAGVSSFITLASPASAEDATVVLNDGRTLQGELVSQDTKEVVLSISGIRTPIPASDVARVEKRQSTEEQFRQRRAALSDADVQGRYDLAVWAFNERAFNLAQAEGQELARLAPEDERIVTLNRAIDAAVRAQSEAPAGRTGGGNNNARPGQQPAGGSAAARPAGAERPETQLLDGNQINRIKVLELPEDLSQADVSITVPRRVVEEVFDKFRADPSVPKSRNEQSQFYGRPDADQLRWLFDMSGANPDVRQYYGDIVIGGDPPALLSFRRLLYPGYVQRYFRETFATEDGVPGLVLFTNERDANAELYTNFYVLSQTSYDGRPLINRNTPEDSLLLQWGLPREAARYPAPDVPNWRPFFTGGVDDPNFVRYAEWVRTLYPQVGDYGVQYTPPGGRLRLGNDASGDEAEPTPAAAPARGDQPRNARPTAPARPAN